MRGGTEVSEKVVALPGSELPDPGCVKVIELIEEVLAEALAGRVTSIGIFTVSPRNVVNTILANNGSPQAHAMTAGALYLLRHCEHNAGSDDRWV